MRRLCNRHARGRCRAPGNEVGEMMYRKGIIDGGQWSSALDDLTETPDLMCAMSVKMSSGLGLVLGNHITLIRSLVAATGARLGRASLGIRERAIRTDVAVDGVGTGRNDGPVVVREHVRPTGGGREERVGRVAIPARGRAHVLGVLPPWSHRTHARVPVRIVTLGALDTPQILAVPRKGALHGVFADEVVGVA